MWTAVRSCDLGWALAPDVQITENKIRQKCNKLGHIMLRSMLRSCDTVRRIPRLTWNAMSYFNAQRCEVGSIKVALQIFRCFRQIEWLTLHIYWLLFQWAISSNTMKKTITLTSCMRHARTANCIKIEAYLVWNSKTLRQRQMTCECLDLSGLGAWRMW